MEEEIKLGWITDPETTFAAVLNHSGEYTYNSSSGGSIDIEPPAECNRINKSSANCHLVPWESGSTEIYKQSAVSGCNQEMLVTWFSGNTSGNTAYTSVLNDASIFIMKNVDESMQIMSTKDPNTFPFITNKAQYFENSGYTDSGYPYICIDPINNPNQKYKSGISYHGHKIKYMPNSNTIPSNCIVNNDSFVELYIPYYEGNNSGRTITAISANAFSNNENLSAITLGQVVTIGDYAFSDCGIVNIDWGHCNCKSSKVKTIGEGAFSECESLLNILLPDTVQSLGDYAFYGCPSSTEIHISTNSGLTTISRGCFDGCINLTELNIPNNITDIKEDAFHSIGWAKELTTVSVPNSVKNIASQAFCSGGKLKFYVNWDYETIPGDSSVTLLDRDGNDVTISKDCFVYTTQVTIYAKNEDYKDAYSLAFDDFIGNISFAVGTL